MRKNKSTGALFAGNPGTYTIVIKVGTSSLLHPERESIHMSALSKICETVVDLTHLGHRVALVTSGAVGVGCLRLNVKRSNVSTLAQKQALAAIGQVHLMRYYDEILHALKQPCAQVLLTLDNLASRGSYTNARNTFRELLRFGVVPIVNENDTVAVEQLRFGDNDSMSAQVAALIGADYLFLLTDVDALYTANPNTDPTATPIRIVEHVSELNVDTSEMGTAWGTGGMGTKLLAARIASAAGCKTIIMSSADPSLLINSISGEQVGTTFLAQPRVLKGRKRWIISCPLKGSVTMDAGAVKAVVQRRKSLFAAGITDCDGSFMAGDCVSLKDESGQELARGLVNYSSEEICKLAGHPSSKYGDVLGYIGVEEIVHRDNIGRLHKEDKATRAYRDAEKKKLFCESSDSDADYGTEFELQPEHTLPGGVPARIASPGPPPGGMPGVPPGMPVMSPRVLPAGMQAFTNIPPGA